MDEVEGQRWWGGRKAAPRRAGPAEPAGRGDAGPAALASAIMTRRALALFAVCTALVAACSSGSGSNPPGAVAVPVAGSGAVTTTTAPVMTVEEAVGAFADCMRDGGVEMSDIRLDARGVPILSEHIDEIGNRSLEVRTALAECAGILIDAGVLDVRTDPELQRVIVAQLEVFSECMREQGVEDFPDPSPGFDGTGLPYPPERLSFEHEAFREAVLVCQSVIEGMDSG